jgi:CspA family cold shock protein
MSATLGSGLTGFVVDFDPAVGLGAVETTAGERFDFHCIEIANGSREIAVGAAVTFDVFPKLGRWEAANLRQ